MLRTYVLSLLLSAAMCGIADAKQLLVEYTATVSNPDTQFGVSIPFGTSVSGHFTVDTSTAVEGNGNDVYFHHQVPGGFTASFPGLSVVADDYRVKLLNNVSQPIGGPVDFFTIQFDSGLVSGLPDPFPFTVNGVPLDETSTGQGHLELNFVGNVLYSGTSSPTTLGFSEDLEFGDFDRVAVPLFSFFNDSSPASGGGGSPTFLLPNTFEVSVVPEPSAWLLGAIGAGAAWVLWRWKLRRRAIG